MLITCTVQKSIGSNPPHHTENYNYVKRDLLFLTFLKKIGKVRAIERFEKKNSV